MQKPQDRASGRDEGRLLYIDGLRGIAILSVIGFHARVPGMPGGFVGVDIFFVISGFVITRQILTAIRDKRFSVREFYVRRILRILPPILLVCVVTAFFASYFPLLPREFKELYQAVAATAAMVSNYYFSSKVEYFSVKSEIQPLLHTWSLGVEEQYYLFAPWVILGLFAISSRRMWAPVRLLMGFSIAVVVTSLITAVIVTRADHHFAFYSLPTRAWQFAAGATLAIAVFGGTTLPPRLRTTAGIVGAAAIVGSVVLIDGRTPYPGTAALWPTLGAALLLIGGIGTGQTPLVRMLATPPLVAIGAVSYSWYLWHWPCLALIRSLDLTQDIIWRNLAASTFALALAVLTYLSLERPMKRMRQSDLPHRRGGQLIALGLVASLLICASSIALSYNPGLQRTSSAESIRSPSLATTGCRADLNAPAGWRGHTCVTGTGDKASVLFWGDSHTYDEIADWAAQAVGQSSIVSAYAACPPLLTVDIIYFANPAKCTERNNAVRKWLQSSDASHIGGVVLVARWNFYNGEPAPSFNEGTVARLRPRTGSGSGGFPAMLAEGLHNQLKYFQDHGQRVLVLGPTPELRQSGTDCMFRAEIYKQPRDTCAMPRSDVDRRRRETVEVLRRAASQFINARFVDPIDVFCDAKLCHTFDENGLLYFDDNHLSGVGRERLYRHFEDEFRWVSGGSAATP